MSFVAAVAALVYAVADVSVWEALPEQATVAGARRAPTGGAFLVRGVDDFVDPVDVARHFGVHARPVGSGAAVAVAGHSLQTPTPVRFLIIMPYCYYNVHISYWYYHFILLSFIWLK